MNDDVQAFYTNSIPKESQCTSFDVVVLVQKGGIERRSPV